LALPFCGIKNRIGSQSVRRASLRRINNTFGFNIDQSMKKLILLILRYMPFLFGCCIAAVAVMSIVPSAAVPDILNFGDKAQHALAFAMLSLIGSLANPKKTKVVYIGLMVFAVSIEVVQKNFTTSHIADVRDLLASGLGLLIGVLIYFLMRKVVKYFD